MMGQAFAIGIVAFVISGFLTPVFQRLARAFGHMAMPNDRSSHILPTPRSGGVAILLAIAGASLVASIAGDPMVAATLVGATTLGMLALVDEYRPLPRISRLIAQFGVAAYLVLAGGLRSSPTAPDAPVDVGLLGAIATVVWIVGVINAYNFMDGVNGLASIQAIVGAFALGLLLFTRDATAALLCAATIGASGGFLPWNFPRASIFMGDIGSNTLGVIFAALTARAASDGVPFVVAALPIAPFLLDAGVTLAVRAARREAFFSMPHRQHFYQRLVDRGWSHASVTAVWGALAVASSLAAVLAAGLDLLGRSIAVGVVLLLHAAVGAAILRAGRRQTVRAL